MRFPGKFPPQSAAERQRKCRAIKKGTWRTLAVTYEPHTPGISNPNLLPPPVQAQPAALPAPEPAQTPSQPQLPAPPTTAIQKAFSPDATAMASQVPEGGGGGLGLSLPAGVEARLQSLLNRHKNGKPLTAAERSEAQGLLDIAEYFVVQRLRNRLAA
jgi:hypothetical protein